MQRLKEKFTKWYIRKGYRFYYERCTLDISKERPHIVVTGLPVGDAKASFICPWWVRPLLIFFSPSVYYVEYYGKQIMQAFIDGLKSIQTTFDETHPPAAYDTREERAHETD